MSKPTASIIILTKNAGEYFHRLLTQIYRQEFSGAFEVIVIDSGSTDGTVEVARRFPVRFRAINPYEFHHGRTRNLGASLAEGDYLVYITQDALPQSNLWLQSLTTGLHRDDVAMVVGRQIAWNSVKPPERFFYRYYFPTQDIQVFYGADDYYRDNMFISSVNSAIKKEIWQKFKFAENVVLAEDKELARRLLLAGWRIVYSAGAPVYHAHDFSLKYIFNRSIESGIALRQGVNVPRSKNWIIKRLGYFIQEAKYVIDNEKPWKWLPYSMVYEVTRILGIITGCIKYNHLKKV